MKKTTRGSDQASQIPPRVDIPPTVTELNDEPLLEVTTLGTRKTTPKTNAIDNGTIANNGSDNLIAGGDPVVTSRTFGNIFNGTTAIIAGIVGSAILALVLLLFALFKYKRREDNAYNMGRMESTPSNRPMVNGNKKNYQNGSIEMKNGSIKSNGKIPKERETAKEYFV